jgi:hypothetical protein
MQKRKKQKLSYENKNIYHCNTFLATGPDGA